MAHEIAQLLKDAAEWDDDDASIETAMLVEDLADALKRHSEQAAQWKQRHDLVLQKHIECCGAGWRLIETAPKDGTKIDLWHPQKGRLADAFWSKHTYTLYEPYGFSNPFWGRITGATHWMPRPVSPDHSEDARNG